MSEALPLASRLRRFESGQGQHLLIAGGSRIYDIDEETARAVDAALTLDDQDALPTTVARLLGDMADPPRSLSTPPPITALSLNLVQACNMGCGYCYAEQGSFGGEKRAMSGDVARKSVDRLLEWTPAGGRAALVFMGGEPLLARELLHETTRYAWDAAKRRGRSISFAMTTNATLLRESDAAFIADFPFTVTVSLDGPPLLQNRQRPMLGGGPSSSRVLRGLEFLLKHRPRQLTARVTVDASMGALLPVLDYVLGLGCDSAGLSPVVASPIPSAEIRGDTLLDYTAELIRCGHHALSEAIAGRNYSFSNFQTAMIELHRGSARAHSCGAGAGYLSIDADGEAFACHRLVGDGSFHFGSLERGIDTAARLAHLNAQAVDRQEPCRSCWARYLCGGGCYHEVSRRGRTMCDHIRSWLDFCLSAYAELSASRPDLFVNSQSEHLSSEMVP